MKSTATSAEAVLRSNDRGAFTVPSRKLYPHLWAWDSGFAAIGWSTIDTGRALDELERLFKGQWDDGRIPHIAFDPQATDYFPGPDFWQCEGSSTITNPPVWTLALRIISERGGDPGRIQALLPKVEASHQFFADARDPKGWGGVAVVHPWESGRDNCPAWDEPLSFVDPALAPPFRRVDTSKVADPKQRPTDDQYKRYAVILRAIASDGFGPGEYSVYDPFMTAVLVRAETDLEWLCTRYSCASNAKQRREVAQECLIERLWDPELGRCVFVDAKRDRVYSPQVLAAYAPVIAGAGELTPQCEATLLSEFASQWRLATVSPRAGVFDPRCYWRGPCWISTNWLFATGASPSFGAQLFADSMNLIEKSGFWEYFDPHTGDGLGADEFSWTAALYLDMAKRIGA